VVTEQSSRFAFIYPGSLVPSLSWDDPRWADVDYGSYVSLLEGFAPLDGSGLPKGAGGLTAPTRIEIPAIGLDSTIKALEVLNFGDARGWETPKDVVGHIPTTAKPGEAGNVYLFGHLQSPVKGEGSVFRNLTRIPDILRKGQDVYAVLYNEEDTAYLYQVVQTGVIKASDFVLEDTSGATVTLVSCVPAYVYDHRLLVTAKLVGVKGK
jgi:LPXTG-site transpeptidase (sortase) family protein